MFTCLCRFNVSRVTASLLLSGAPAVREDTLISLGVNCVISAAPELPPPPLPPQVALVLRLPLRDQPSEDILSRLHTTADTIHQVILFTPVPKVFLVVSRTNFQRTSSFDYTPLPIPSNMILAVPLLLSKAHPFHPNFHPLPCHWWRWCGYPSGINPQTQKPSSKILECEQNSSLSRNLIDTVTKIPRIFKTDFLN